MNENSTTGQATLPPATGGGEPVASPARNLVPAHAAGALPVRQAAAKRAPGRRWWLRVILAVAVLAAGGGASYYWWQRLHSQLPPGIAFGNGRLEADEIDIDTKYAGRIAEMLADEGDMVKAGQVVARMDTQGSRRLAEEIGSPGRSGPAGRRRSERQCRAAEDPGSARAAGIRSGDRARAKGVSRPKKCWTSGNSSSTAPTPRSMAQSAGNRIPARARRGDPRRRTL